VLGEADVQVELLEASTNPRWSQSAEIRYRSIRLREDVVGLVGGVGVVVEVQANHLSGVTERPRIQHVAVVLNIDQ